MARIVLTAEVEDAREWEASFRTHIDLFRSLMSKSPTSFTATQDNEVVIYAETDDLGAFMKVIESQAMVDAMDKDGVKRETVKIYVLDKSLDL